MPSLSDRGLKSSTNTFSRLIHRSSLFGFGNLRAGGGRASGQRAGGGRRCGQRKRLEA